jgi:predicted permease
VTAGRRAASRVFDALLRAYPARTRARFGDAIRYGWHADLDAARAAGRAATLAFWTTTVIDAVRFGLAERTGGFAMRGMLTVDWRDAWRSLRAAPLVCAFAVLSLALGIGGVTALFSILNSIALKPLPVRDPGRLVILEEGSFTNPIWEAIRDRQSAIAERAFAWAADNFNLSPSGSSDMVQGLWVSGGLFDTLGVSAVIGRAITTRDDVRGGGPDGPVAVISHRLWQRRFGGAPAVIGRTLTIEGVPFTIVGVAPERFFGPDVGRAFDVAVPLGTEPLVRPRDSALDQRTTWWMNVMARLKPGQSAEEATALIRAVQPQIRAETMPQQRTAEGRAEYLSEPLTFAPAPGGRSLLRSRYQRPLMTILAVVGVVLLIACANIANLLIARASTRRHELTLRMALGASRFRIAKQLLAESVWLVAAGAAIGVLFARWGSALLVSQLTTYNVIVDLDLALDRRVLAFAIAVSAAAALLAGLAPALTVGGIAAHDALQGHGRVAGGRRAVVRHASVVLQVALSLALVVTGGLLTRTFVTLITRDAGFDRRGVLIVGARVDRNPVSEEARLPLFERFAQAAAAVPGAASAAASYTTPTSSAGWNTMIEVPPDSPLTRRQRMTWVNVVSPGWFHTVGLPLVAGRDFDARDRPGAPRVVIVNRAFERRFLAGRAPLGATVMTADPGTPKGAGPKFEVVGVVEDIIYRSLRSPMEPILYYPLAQSEGVGTGIMISVRAASGPPRAIARSAVAAIAREDPTAVLTVRTLAEQVDGSLAQERLLATLAAFFSGLALLLSALGLYGVTSQAVTARRAEIGIRMALGATAEGVVRLVLRRTAWMVGAGIVVGAGLSMWAVPFTKTLLYDMEPRDPTTFVGAALMLIAVAAIAAWLPARRASRIDPVQVLRQV